MLIRPAVPADAAEVAEIHLAARAAALPGVRWAHDAEDVRHWVATALVPGGGVWMAEQGGIAGYMALEGDMIGHLYLRPERWRRGIGTALLNHAKALRPDGLRLWCFQVNARARAFYQAHGFVAARFTDGADNEEREPDILYAWRPAP
ncbi:MAG TPA: GNAT family N-acetyltransferase [Acetobacteraceae bacterium]